jgi:blue copper oxidase
MIKLSKNQLNVVLLLLSLGAVMSLWLALSSNSSNHQEPFDTSRASSGNLFIPSLLDYTTKGGVKNFSLTAQEGSYEFVDGVVSDTLGFNGDILGPTIRVNEGDEVNFAVTNNLKEQTTSHWHGAIVPGDADGGVHNIIQPEETWDARFKVRQEAATLWYHPHQHEETARQVYEGLGGFLLIDDDNSKNLNIPDEYGVDDIPLIIQSKDLDQNGKLIEYSTSMHERIHGFEGNTVLINAQIKPSLKTDSNLLRLRILNGSNSDIYQLTLSNGDPFYVIASDGGFYNKPVKMTSLEVPNAKRFEILVDISKFSGESISLDVNGSAQLTIEADETLQSKYEIPTTTNNLIPHTYDGSITREFDLEFLMGRMGMMGGSYGINGQLFDMERVDFEVEAGTVEYWKVANQSRPGPGVFHPFHVHGTQFGIVEFNGKEPDILQQGRHDTIYLDAGDEAVIAVPIDESIDGIFLFHCHLLEHEDGGMMGQFRVVQSEGSDT